MVRYYLAAIALKALSISPSSRRLYRWLGNTTEQGDVRTPTSVRIGAADNCSSISGRSTRRFGPTIACLRSGRDGCTGSACSCGSTTTCTSRWWMSGKTDSSWPSNPRSGEPRGRVGGRNAAAGGSESSTSTERVDVRGALRPSRPRVRRRPAGDLSRFPDRFFNGVFSFHVLEHLDRNGIPRFLENMARVLSPGEISIHQIGIDDHLAHYDTSASAKQYLAYSDATWSRRFEIGCSTSIVFNSRNGLNCSNGTAFDFAKRSSKLTTIDGLEIDPRWADYSLADKTCTIATVVHERD